MRRERLEDAQRRRVRRWCKGRCRWEEELGRDWVRPCFHNVKQSLTRYCSWTVEIWGHCYGSWLLEGMAVATGNAIRRAFSCGGAQSRVDLVVKRRRRRCLPRGGGRRARVVSEGVSLKHAQQASSDGGAAVACLESVGRWTMSRVYGRKRWYSGVETPAD